MMDLEGEVLAIRGGMVSRIWNATYWGIGDEWLAQSF